MYVFPASRRALPRPPEQYPLLLYTTWRSGPGFKSITPVPTPAERFGANLKRARKAREMTQEALGLAAGLDAAVISRIEAGQREPRVTNIAKIAKALEVPPGDFFEGV